MNFKECLDQAKNLIDEVEQDTQIDIILKNALNEAYTELSTIDKQVRTTYIPVINGKATFPLDIVKVVNISPSDSNAKLEGNAYYTSSDGIITLDYVATREPLVLETDEIILNKQLQYAMTLYGAYRYYQHRRKTDIANMFLNNYLRTLSMFTPVQLGNEFVRIEY